MKTLLLLSCLLFLPLTGCNNDQTSAPGINPYAGRWFIAFTGTFGGTRTVSISPDGNFSFNAYLTGFSKPFTIFGSVSVVGNVSAEIVYNTARVGSLTGRLTGSGGSGSYQTTTGNGTWTATKQ